MMSLPCALLALFIPSVVYFSLGGVSWFASTNQPHLLPCYSRGDERGASASCRQDTRSPTDPTPVPSPQPSQQHTPEPPLQPSTRATPSLLGKRRRDDGANKVLRQMLYESHRLDSLTDARNRQDAAFQQSMLEAIWEVTDAVQV
ncbi:hypothetical protein V5799_000703 [Amblyomma americanum]|uniref:Secreted protein n=1 Tax=Amblyomma americanum TaxID=6943 RepID=A0AAQ4D2A4_AMBAM